MSYSESTHFPLSLPTLPGLWWWLATNFNVSSSQRWLFYDFLVTFKESLVNFPSLPLPDTLPELHNIWLNKTAYLLINKLTVSFIMTHAAIIVSSHYYPLASLSCCSTAGHCVGMVAVKLPLIPSAKGRERKTLDHAVSCWSRQNLLCCRGERLKYLLLRGLKTMEILVSSVMTSGEWVKCQRRSVNTEIVFMDCYCLLPKSGDQRRQAVDTPW